MKLFLLLLLLISCNDFTDRNAIPEKHVQVLAGQSLLENIENINQGEFTPEKLIANTGIYVVAPTVEKLNSNIQRLNQSYRQYCSALKLFKNENYDLAKHQNLLSPLKDSWKESMTSFHLFAAMNIGPTAEDTVGPLTSIYSFDQVDKCRLDQAIVLYDLRKQLPRFDVINNFNVRGLDSIERLLFGDQENSICSRVNARMQAYYAKPLLEKAKTSCEFGQHLFTDIVSSSKYIANKWSLNAGFYTQKMLSGSEGNPIDVVNKISQALFYLDTETKDVKLAYPAGFEVKVGDTVKKCVAEKCAESREHTYSDFSLEAAFHALLGFKYLFFGINPETGENGMGLDDLLISRGHKDVADDIANNLEEVLIRIKNLAENKSFSKMLNNVDPDKCDDTTSEDRLVEACALVWDVRKVTNILKNEYLAALVEFNAPKRAQGDND